MGIEKETHAYMST